MYRHRPGLSMCTHTSRKTLLRLRLRAFERRVLSQPSWSAGFSIWGAGRDGRNFITELQLEHRRKVRAMCDIDPAKIGTGATSNHSAQDKCCFTGAFSERLRVWYSAWLRLPFHWRQSSTCGAVSRRDGTVCCVRGNGEDRWCARGEYCIAGLRRGRRLLALQLSGTRAEVWRLFYWFE